MTVAPGGVLGAGDIVDVVAQGDKEIEKELSSAVEHLKLHGSTALKGAAAANDESEVMGPEFRVRIGSVGVGVAGGCQDGAALDTRLQTLLPQSHLLELLQAKLLSCAVNDRVLEDVAVGSVVVDGGLESVASLVGLFDFPRVSLLVVDQARKVVTLVHVLQNRAKDFRLLIWKVNSSAARGSSIHEHRRQSLLEPGRGVENIFVSSKDALLFSDNKSNNRW